MAMDHGSKNEINAISTLVGKILPSLFPGIWYYEEGCIALEHDGEFFVLLVQMVAEGLLSIANLYTQLK